MNLIEVIFKKHEKIILFVFTIIYEIKWRFPYNNAVLLMAYNYYTKSERYKERCDVFGEEKAQEMFTNEYDYYYKHLTFMDKLKCAIIPYSIIDG